MPSPCLTCDFKNKDKNNERCRNCKKRLEYNVSEGNLPQEVLETENQDQERDYEERLATVAETQMAVDMLDLKAGESSKKRRGRPRSKKKGEDPRIGIYIRPTEFCSSIQVNEIMEGVKEIANSELRSLPQQVLWILKEKVKEWNEAR